MRRAEDALFLHRCIDIRYSILACCMTAKSYIYKRITSPTAPYRVVRDE